MWHIKAQGQKPRPNTLVLSQEKLFSTGLCRLERTWINERVDVNLSTQMRGLGASVNLCASVNPYTSARLTVLTVKKQESIWFLTFFFWFTTVLPDYLYLVSSRERGQRSDALSESKEDTVTGRLASNGRPVWRCSRRARRDRQRNSTGNFISDQMDAGRLSSPPFTLLERTSSANRQNGNSIRPDKRDPDLVSCLLNWANVWHELSKHSSADQLDQSNVCKYCWEWVHYLFNTFWIYYKMSKKIQLAH